MISSNTANRESDKTAGQITKLGRLKIHFRIEGHACMSHKYVDIIFNNILSGPTDKESSHG